jgi:MFS family permease
LGASFRKLWFASAISNLGDGVHISAAPLLAAALTRDPALVAGLVFAQRLPWLLFALVSGALVDRLDRRLVMGLANIFRAVVIGALGLAMLLGWGNLPLPYLTFFLLGTAETLIDNAAFAILPAIVPRCSLETANGRLYSTQTVTNEFAGPPLGGLLFGLRQAAAFLTTAGVFALAGLAALSVRAQTVPAAASASSPATLRADIVEGLHWFWGNRILRTLGIMDGVFGFVSTATLSVFVLLAQEQAGLDDFTFGLVLSAGAFGGFAGGLSAGRIVGRLGRGRAIFLTYLLPGLAYAVMAAAPQPAVIALMFVFVSFAVMVGDVVIISLRQAIIPDHLLGRVTGAYRLFSLGAAPAGALGGGILARSTGLTGPYWAGSLLLVVLAVTVLPVINDRTLDEALGQS